VGLALPALSSSPVVLAAALPILAVMGGAALVLPYALLTRLMPEESHGAGAALFDVSNGAGTLLGPVIAGASIDLLGPLFASTKGYAAMWPPISAATLLSVAVLSRAPEESAALHP
jgi:MFS family permease